MKYKKVICIDNDGDDRLIFHKEYRARIYTEGVLGNSIFIYDNGELIDLFSSNMFKSVEKIRKERLNNIL